MRHLQAKEANQAAAWGRDQKQKRLKMKKEGLLEGGISVWWKELSKPTTAIKLG